MIGSLVDSDDDDDELCTLVVALMQKGSRKKKAITSEGCLSIGNISYSFRIFRKIRIQIPNNLESGFFEWWLLL